MPSTLSYLMPFTAYPYQGEAVACDLCGASEFEVICERDRRFKKLRTVACLRCGLMRTDPMPTPEEVARYYAESYRWDYQFAGKAGPSARHLNRSRKQARARLDLLAPALHPGARVLDFGSGAGVFLGLAAAAGHSVLGIEPGRDYAAYARKTFGVEVLGKMWEEIDEPLGRFDVITTVEVLEHLRRPVAALRWLASLLAEDGVLYVTVPDITPNAKETFRRFHFAHLHNFTPQTLVWAGAVCGLKPDPRFERRSTRIVFHKAKAPAQVTFDRNHGEGLSRIYPNDSIARYVLSGGMFMRSLRQLRTTVRDTVWP